MCARHRSRSRVLVLACLAALIFSNGCALDEAIEFFDGLGQLIGHSLSR